MIRPLLVPITTLIIASFLLVFDLFLHPGRPATFDGPTHITTIAQFHSSLKDGHFPVRWAANYGNFGQPLGLYAHQLPAYLGALVMFIAPQPELAYKIVFAFAAIFSTLSMFFLLTQWYPVHAAFIATLFFNTTAYRIINIYLRGALPEFLATSWIITSLIAFTLIVRHQHLKLGWLILAFSQAALLLTHPIISILWGLLIIPGLIWGFIKHKALCFYILTALLTGFLLSAYYIIPLVIESKYLIIGHEESNIPTGVTLQNYISPNWNYFSDNSHPGPRENLPKFGLIESAVLVLGTIAFIRKSRHTNMDLLLRIILSVTIICIITTFEPVSRVYGYIPFLKNIQYTWRWFAILIVVPPVLIAYFIKNTRRYSILLAIGVFLILYRLPQAYGKNYYQVPTESYFNTPATLHSTNLNTIWMSHWRDYPQQSKQIDFIDTKGTISSNSISTALKHFTIQVDSPSNIVAYTFYFPGWFLFINGQESPIEFQDVRYRGLITFMVPPGTHDIVLKFSQTKVRLFSDYVSLVTLIILLVLAFKVKVRWSQNRLKLSALE